MVFLEPFPLLQNSTNMTAVVQMTNTITEGWFGLAILGMTFIIAMAATIRYGAKRAFATASLISFVIAGFLTTLKILNQWWLFTVILLVFISVVWLYLPDQ